MAITELIGIAIGCMLLALGGTSIGAWSIRRRRAERLLLEFGTWCVLYGVRLIALQPVVRDSIGGSIRAWEYVIAFITYGINIPTSLFFESLAGSGWMQSLRRVRQVQVAYAVVAIAASLVMRNPLAAMPLNNSLVLTSLAIQGVNVWWFRERLSLLFTTKIIVVAGAGLAMAVVNENLGRLVFPAVNLEPVGVLMFVLALGQAVIGRVVRGEAELLAVQRELETARKIQQSLLPREAPRARGLDVAVRFVPMSAVAGDLYDFVALGPSRLGLLVADVSGHGIPAALVAAMVKLAFAEAERTDDPAHVLATVNRALCRQLEHGFVTALYAVIDAAHSSITVANAGHPPLLIGSSSRSVVEVHEHGLMLGVIPDASYQNAEVELQDGDRILLYTDGVIEAQNAAGEFFDAERVARWLMSDHTGDVKRFGDEALADLHRWRGHLPFEDDVTFVIARFTTGPQIVPD